MVFLMQSWVYLVVILRACVFAVFAMLASEFIHSCWFVSWAGGGGIVAYVWFASIPIMGCVRQFMEFLVRYIAFLIKW